MMEGEIPTSTEGILAVPGVVSVCPSSGGSSVVLVGPAAGFIVPRGIARWEQELSFVARGEMTEKFAGALKATRPIEQIAPKKLPHAWKAVSSSPFLPLRSKLLPDARKQGVRVHTVGVDRVSAGFYYFAEGGGRPEVHVQGNLVEMLVPSLTDASTNAEIAALREGLIDRLLAHFSGGIVSELAVELAAALPRLSRDGKGLVGTYLEVFEVQARALARRSARFEAGARDLSEALLIGSRQRKTSVDVPLFGEAKVEISPPLDVEIEGKVVRLPERRRWTVTGKPDLKTATTPSMPPPSMRPSGAPPSLLPPPPAAPEVHEDEVFRPRPKRKKERREDVVAASASPIAGTWPAARVMAVLLVVLAFAHLIWRLTLPR